jgi:hypothetical protein
MLRLQSNVSNGSIDLWQTLASNWGGSNAKLMLNSFLGNLMLPHLQPLLLQRTLPPSLRELNVSG